MPTPFLDNATLLTARVVLNQVSTALRNSPEMAQFLYVTRNGTSVVSSLVTKPRGATRFVMISDTHNLHRKIDVPAGDVLLHSGDILLRDRGMNDPLQRGMDDLWDFNVWLGEQKRTKGFFSAFVIAGNHDTTLADLGTDKTRAVLSNAQYLYNTEIAVPGTDIRVYGTPLHLPNTAKSTNTSFQPFERGSEDLKSAYARIPKGVDVLLTHGPPTGLGQKSGDAACSELENTLRSVEPFLHVHGHNHHGYGASKLGRTSVINACQLNGMFQVTKRQLPVVMDITEDALQAHRMNLADLPSEPVAER